jgi:hypothetical protein
VAVFGTTTNPYFPFGDPERRKAKVCAFPRRLDLFDAPEHDLGALHRIEVDTVATASAQDRLFAVTSPAVDVRSPLH